MGDAALVLTAVVLALTACAVVAQLWRWHSSRRAERERRAREVHDDPRWRKWAERHADDDDRRAGGKR